MMASISGYALVMVSVFCFAVIAYIKLKMSVWKTESVTYETWLSFVQSETTTISLIIIAFIAALLGKSLLTTVRPAGARTIPYDDLPLISKAVIEGKPEPVDQYVRLRSLGEVWRNVLKSGEVGKLVANDFKSSVIYVPLEDINPKTGKPLDYREFSENLERVRDQFQTDSIKIHIVGFAKVVGDLIEGAARVLLFFGIAFIILLLFLYANSRCLRSTLVRAVSSLVAVIWQLGLLSLLGYGLNPYSMLAPFLMFALGVSHGIQMGQAMVHEMMAGADKLTGARRAYRKVYIPGLAALMTDGVGFLTLFVIAIGVIQDIAIGVAVVAFTDLMLLPVLMSYTGVSPSGIRKLRNLKEARKHPVWRLMAHFTRPKVALIAIAVAFAILAFGFHARQGLKIGDLDPGAPELRTDSRCNLDNAFMTKRIIRP